MGSQRRDSQPDLEDHGSLAGGSDVAAYSGGVKRS